MNNTDITEKLCETRSCACKFVLPTIKSLHMCPIRIIVGINKKLKFYSPSGMNIEFVRKG
jgi:hypothetical protein